MEITWISDTIVTQLVLLLIAFGLSCVIGIERELRHKNAGARTHTLVGTGSALFTLVSAYGFDQVLGADVVLDPSRIAAQIVSGIGFLGAGVIFMRKHVLSGLTTAASIWVVAAVGMATGAGMPLIAAATVVLYLFAVTAISLLVGKIREPLRDRTLIIRYIDGGGVLRDILEASSRLGYEATLQHTQRFTGGDHTQIEATAAFRHREAGGQGRLIETLSGIPGVMEVLTADDDRD